MKGSGLEGPSSSSSFGLLNKRQSGKEGLGKKIISV